MKYGVSMRGLIPLMVWVGCATPIGKMVADAGSGDTAEAASSDAAGPGDACEGDGVLDCANECWIAEVRNYVGDRTCDTGQRGPDLSCAAFDYDGGDCEPEDGTTGSDDGIPATGAEDTGSEATAGEETGGTGTADDPTAGDESSSTGGAADPTAGGSTTGGSATDGESTEVDLTGWECDVPGPFDVAAPGAYDCREVCVPLIYHRDASEHPSGLWGDGNCDDAGPHPDAAIGSEYADFNCVEFGHDGGDCPPA